MSSTDTIATTASDPTAVVATAQFLTPVVLGLQGLTINANQCPVKRQWPRLLSHIQQGYLKPSDIVTHHIPLDEIAEGYHMFSAKLDDCIKPVVVFDE